MTRMWLGVEPSELCDQHLLGEHAELHQEVGTLRNHPHGEAIFQGHIDAAQVFPTKIPERHRDLVAEMIGRGMAHKSPLRDFDAEEMPASPYQGEDYIKEENRVRLRGRCEDCRARMGATA